MHCFSNSEVYLKYTSFQKNLRSINQVLQLLHSDYWMNMVANRHDKMVDLSDTEKSKINSYLTQHNNWWSE